MNKKYILGGSCLLITFLFIFCRNPPANNWDIDKSTEFKQIIFFGDSLTSGYGLKDQSKSFPNIIGRQLNIPVKIYGYPGNTTADGLKKLSNLENEPPSLLVLTLGGNDILRRLNLDETDKNLREIIQALKLKGHTVVFTEVLSIMAGKRHQIYLEICKDMKIVMVPDILKGMLSDSESMQGDSIHPDTKGCRIISDRIITTLKETGILN